MINEQLKNIPVSELIKGKEKEFGIKLENSDERRSIYSVIDKDIFLNESDIFGLDVSSILEIKKYFEKYPEALVQFFIINKPKNEEKIKLGGHYHTDVQEGGSGTEVFILTDVPPDTNIKLEQYSLGKAKGNIRYSVKTGSVMVNEPNDYHILESDGPFTMVQILVGGFSADDLNKLKKNNRGKSDDRMVNGSGDFN